MTSIATARNTPLFVTEIDILVNQLIGIQCKAEISNLAAQNT